MTTLPHRFCKDEKNAIYMIQKYNSETRTITAKKTIFSDCVSFSLDEVQLFTPAPGNSRLFDKYYLGDLYKRKRSSEKKYKILKDEDAVLIYTERDILHFNKTRGVLYASSIYYRSIEINFEVNAGWIYDFMSDLHRRLSGYPINSLAVKINPYDMKLIDIEQYHDAHFLASPDSYVVRLVYNRFCDASRKKKHREVIDFLKSEQYLSSVKERILKCAHNALQSFIPGISVKWVTNIIKDYL